MGATLLLQATSSAQAGYGASLLQALLALAAVCVLAWVVLRWGARSGFGALGGGKRVRVLERVPLDARRTLFVLRVGEKVLLVGAGNEGPPALLATLEAHEVPEPEARAGDRFAEAIARVRGELRDKRSGDKEGEPPASAAEPAAPEQDR